MSPKPGDYARAQASGVLCVPLLVETFGGTPQLVNALRARRPSGARTQADFVGVRRACLVGAEGRGWQSYGRPKASPPPCFYNDFRKQ